MISTNLAGINNSLKSGCNPSPATAMATCTGSWKNLKCGKKTVSLKCPVVNRLPYLDLHMAAQISSKFPNTSHHMTTGGFILFRFFFKIIFRTFKRFKLNIPRRIFRYISGVWLPLAPSKVTVLLNWREKKINYSRKKKIRESDLDFCLHFSFAVNCDLTMIHPT